jgi:hypothetical protein
VEVVAVDAHVQVVEGAHRRPAVLVGEGDRGQAVALDLLCQRDELVPGLGRLVAALLEDALPVEDRPRVVVEGDEVLLAVEAGGGLLERVGEVAADLPPHVGDGARQAALGEELHAVAGEPHEHVVGSALQVVVDLLLERLVLDRVDLGGVPGRLLEVGEDLLIGLLGHRVRGVGADRDLLAAGAAATAPAAAAVLAAGGEPGHAGAHPEHLEHVAPAQTRSHPRAGHRSSLPSQAAPRAHPTQSNNLARISARPSWDVKDCFCWELLTCVRVWVDP